MVLAHTNDQERDVLRADQTIMHRALTIDPTVGAAPEALVADPLRADDAAEAEVRGRRVDRLGHPGGWTVAAAVVEGAEV